MGFAAVDEPRPPPQDVPLASRFQREAGAEVVVFFLLVFLGWLLLQTAEVPKWLLPMFLL